MANPADAQKWRDGLSTLAPQLEFRQWPDIGNPAEVHYILAWEPLPSLVEQFGNLRLLYAAGAGVDQFDLARLPAHASLIRLVDFHRALQKSCFTGAANSLAAEGRYDSASLFLLPIESSTHHVAEVNWYWLLGLFPIGGSRLECCNSLSLALSVPLVTAMQTLRLVLVLFLVEPLYRCWQRRGE